MSTIQVVLADDNDIYRRGLRELLRLNQSVDVVASAKNGAEALAAVTEKQPDLLILDLQMPEVDGWAVLRQLRNAPTRILVLSSHADTYTCKRALAHGAAAYVPKGNIPLLLNTLQQFLVD